MFRFSQRLQSLGRSPAGVSSAFRASLRANSAATTAAAPTAMRPVNLDRELPDPFLDQKKNKRYFIVYAIGVTVSCALIFNYEKTRSPIINSVMYCLRRSEYAQQGLGSNIGFASSWPWIWGKLNAVQGEIDVEYRVKGDAGAGMLKMKANRESKLVPFDVKQLTLVMDDGRLFDLKTDPSIDFEL